MFLAAPRLRVRRGLAGWDRARMSAVVGSGCGSGDDSVLIAARFSFGSAPRQGPCCLVDTHSGKGYVSVLAAAPFEGGQNSGGVAQLGERVNGIHEVRGSIPLASTGPLRLSTIRHCW